MFIVTLNKKQCIRILAYVVSLFFIDYSNYTIAKIEPQSGVSPQVISLPGGPGTIEGLGESFQPQLNTGTGVYTFPITIPQGRNGFMPSINLIYNGGHGNGIVGHGWKMTSMYIKRQSDKGLPKYLDSAESQSDNFINEFSDELVRVKGNISDEKQVFRLKNENSFMKYVYVKSEDIWICYDRSGNKYFLGSQSNSSSGRIQRPSDQKTYAWYICNAIDTNNNHIQYVYEKDHNQIYLKTVLYGAIEKNSEESIHKIDFFYENRPDPIIDYRSTFRQKTLQRLHEIVVSSSKKIVRKYQLDYIKSELISYLYKLTLFGSDGISKFPSVELQYTRNIPSTSASFIPIQGLSNASILFSDENPEHYPYVCEILDFNGDALPDLYQSQHPDSDYSNFHVIYENQGEGQFIFRKIDIADTHGLRIISQSTLPHDVDGNGLVDLVTQKGSNPENFVYILNEGGRWASNDIPLYFPNNETFENIFRSKNVRMLDLNGDKKIDTLRSFETYDISGQGIAFSAYLNNSDGTFQYIAQTMPMPIKGLSTTFSDSNDRLVVADMNGDRLMDIVLLSDAYLGGLRYWPSMGFGKFDDSTFGYQMQMNDGPDYSGDVEKIKNLEISDLNNDGLADLYLINHSGITYWLNIGGVQFSKEYNIIFDAQISFLDTTYRLLDIDGDNLQDILFYVRNQSTPDYLSTGFYYVRLFQDCDFQLRDNVDNDNDSLIDEADEGNCSPNLLCSINNGIGQTTSILYESHVKQMIRDRKAGNQWQTFLPFPVSVIKQLDIHVDSAPLTKILSYHNGFYDGKENEFRGFADVEQQDKGDESIPDLITLHSYDVGNTEEVLKGKLLKVEKQDLNHNIFYTETYTWETKELIKGIYPHKEIVSFAFQTEKNSHIVEKGKGQPAQLKWEYMYDSYGNLTVLREFGRLSPEWDDERLTETVYSSSYTSTQSLWILDKVITKSVKDFDSNIVSQARYYYDGHLSLGDISKGNLTKVENWVEKDRYIVSVRNEYDSYGNIKKVYDPLFGKSPGHYREMVYDPVFHTYPIKEIMYTGKNDIPELFISVNYDYGFGVVTSAVSMNGFTTNYEYDSFGRLISITKPSDTKHTVEYEYQLAHLLDNGLIINWIEVRQREKDKYNDFLRLRTYYNGSGKAVMTRAEGESNKQIVVSDVILFNARQLTQKKMLPYFEEGNLDYSPPDISKGFIEFTYDALGRTIKTKQPESTTESVFSKTTYQPLEKFVQDEEQVKESSSNYGCGMRYVYDGLLDSNGTGRLREVYEVVNIDNEGNSLNTPTQWKTKYFYDLQNNLVGYFDSQNNQKQFKYDGLGRKIEMEDPDRGTVQYYYDDAGNLIKSIDNKLQEIRYTYDGLNRVLKEFFGDNELPEIEYFYDRTYKKVDRGDLWYSNDLSEIIANLILNENEYIFEFDLNNDGKIDVSDVVKASKIKNDRQMITPKNGLGFLVCVKDSSGEEYNSYDECGRVNWVIKRIKAKDSKTLNNFYTSMTYDSMDRFENIIYSDGSLIQYQYNTRGLLESIPGIIDKIDYNPIAEYQVINYSCDVQVKYLYDHRLRLKKMISTRTNDQLNIQNMSYSYDATSNIIEIKDNRTSNDFFTILSETDLSNIDVDIINDTQTFKYDTLNRLTHSNRTKLDEKHHYRYDQIGNMIFHNYQYNSGNSQISKTLSSGGKKGSWNRKGFTSDDDAGPHALTSILNNDFVSKITYDQNGNIKTYKQNTLIWDYKDKLLGIQNDKYNASYLYDYSGTRKKKYVIDHQGKQEENIFYIDRYSELRNNQFIKYIYIGQKRIASINESLFHENKPSNFYLHDHLGSVVIVLSTDGIVEQIKSYRPYGTQRITNSKSNFSFTGKEKDKESEFYYFESRYMVSEFGRFLSVDPLAEQHEKINISLPQTLNIYIYSNNNPINNIDPDGESFLKNSSIALSRMGREFIKGNFDNVLTIITGYVGGMIYLDMYYTYPDSIDKSYDGTYTNGIFNTKKFAENTANSISKKTGKKIYLNYNPTHGFLDFLQIFFEEFLGATSISAINNGRYIEVLKGKDNIHIYAHSQGTSVVNGSFRLLSAEIKCKIHFQGFGGQTFINARLHGLKSARNVINPGDFIPLLSPFRFLRTLGSSGWEVLPDNRSPNDIYGVKYHYWSNYENHVK